MKLKHAKSIVDLLNDNGGEAEVHEEYSGRGMYGTSTAGIYGSNPVWIGWAAGVLGLEEDDLPYRQDSLGLDIIVY